MQNSKYNYKVLVASLDPNKYARALKDKLFVEVSESADKAEILIKSDQNAVLLKRKLGIVSDSDIIQIKDSSVESTGKGSQSVQIEPKASELEATKVEPGNQSGSEVESEVESEVKSDKGFKMANPIKLEVPILQDVSYQGIENFISDMKRCKTYGRFEQDSDLIFSSLVKSKKTSLFNDMGKGDDEDIDKFAAFLKNIYGISEVNLLDRFKALKQRQGENGLQFFNRLVRLFYKIREAEVPTKTTDRIHILEMTQAFLHGLRNREVSKILSRNRREIDFEKLGTTALDYEKVEDDNVNAVVNKLDHMDIKAKDDTNESHSDEKRVNFINGHDSRRQNSSRDQRFNRNHSRNRYFNNKDFDRRSRGQSRERNFPRYRENSRGRDFSRGRDNSNKTYGRSNSRDQRDYQGEGFNRSMSRDRYQNRSQSRNREFGNNRNSRDYSRDRNRGQGLRRRDIINGGRCFRCGYKGHTRIECRANDKTVAAYKKRQERYQDRRY